jgi:hypothetical protein
LTEEEKEDCLLPAVPWNGAVLLLHKGISLKSEIMKARLL